MRENGGEIWTKARISGLAEKLFREIKRTLAGQERIFDCEALAVTSRLAIVRYVFTRPFTSRDKTYDAGGYTEGFFWRDRHYNLYHIVTREGEPIGDRFDVIDHVRIHSGGVQYDDLLLDVWLYPDGLHLIEDEDEVEEAIAAGQLSPARQNTITRTRQLLLTRGRRIVASALQELAALRRDLPPPPTGS